MNAVWLAAALFLGDAPVKSGLQPPQRPGPYSALVVVGKERGTQHCYICEAGDRPVCIVFARTATDPLGKLVHQLDKAIKKNADVDLRGWVTFLAEDAGPVEGKIVAWSQKHATGGVPAAVFEDVVGPPAYRIAREADVTVILSTKQKTIANFAFRAAELDDAAVARISAAIGALATKK